jgi:hypothetical protein
MFFWDVRVGKSHSLHLEDESKLPSDMYHFIDLYWKSFDPGDVTVVAV